MPQLEPTYLRYIYDGLLKGSIHPENAAELPEGLIGLYEEAFDERQPVHERQQLLERFAIWALLKKEVSVAFVAEVLGDTEDEIQDFISKYSTWFNSPESGKYQLYHERLKVYLLQKLGEGEVHGLHDNLISRLEKAIADKKADEFEWYGLELLGGHLTLSCFQKNTKEKYNRLINYALNDNYHNRQFEISFQYQWTFNLLHTVQHLSIVLRKRDVELINLKFIEVNERLQASIHELIYLVRDGSIEITLVRINCLMSQSENEVKTKLRLILLILTDICVNNKSINSNEHYLISELLQILEFEFKKYKIDVFYLISPNIFFQIVLFLKDSSLDYKCLLNLIIYYDWWFSGISKILTPDFIKYFISSNKYRSFEIEGLFVEIRQILYLDKKNNNSTLKHNYDVTIAGIDCLIIAVLKESSSDKLAFFIKSAFQEFSRTFSHEYINLWMIWILYYLEVDVVIILLREELLLNHTPVDSVSDLVALEIKLEFMNSILLKVYESNSKSNEIKELIEYSENLLNIYVKSKTYKSYREKTCDFFELQILILYYQNNEINTFINQIFDNLKNESDDRYLSKIINTLYFFKLSECAPRFIALYVDKEHAKRMELRINNQIIAINQIENVNENYLVDLIYKLTDDIRRNHLSDTSILLLENLNWFISQIKSDNSVTNKNEDYWERILREIFNSDILECYIETYLSEALRFSPQLIKERFYHLVAKPQLIKKHNDIELDVIRMIDLEIELLKKTQIRQIEKLYDSLLSSFCEPLNEVNWTMKNKDVYRFAKLKLEESEIQVAINCLSEIDVYSQYFVELVFDISLKLFQGNEEIDFAFEILQYVNHHFEYKKYDNGESYSYYHIDHGQQYINLVDNFLFEILSFHQLNKKQFQELLYNVGVMDDNYKLITKNFNSPSFIINIIDKKVKIFICDLLKQNNLLEKPIQFSINRGMANILNYELSDSDIESIINELNEYSNYYWGQDFWPDYKLFFIKIGLSKISFLNTIHKQNIFNLKVALISKGISKNEPIYSFCEFLITKSIIDKTESSLITIFPEFENKSELTEYLHEICLKIKQSRNVYLKDFYHFTFLTENTNRDDLIEELFQKRRFKPKKDLVKLFYLDDFTRRKFLVSFYNNISNFYNSEINWYLVYHLCRSDYNLLKHFNSERIKILLMQGKIPKKLSNLVTDKKDYLSEINKLNNLSVDLI
jgi:hypothetical protein